jgi:hypothetical protein
MRELAGKTFLDHRTKTEAFTVALFLSAFLLATGAANFDVTLNSDMRANVYDPLSAMTGTLLGFVLAALAILVALPSTERIEKLRRHPKWDLIPSTYFRAARALLVALVLCLLGLPLDSGTAPWLPYEAAVVIVLSLSLVRVSAVLASLDQILAVAQANQKKATSGGVNPIDDPGL